MSLLQRLYRTWLRTSILLALALPAAAQTVSMVPHVAMPTTTEFTVYFHLDTDTNDVMGVEISATFNDAVVQLDGIDAGDWFTASGLDWFFWDYTTPGTGTIHFTGALLNQGRTASGVIAVCRFTALAPGVSPVDFTDVDVRDAANQPYPAGHSVDDLIIIDDAIPADSLSFGQVKALYR